MPSLVGSEMCIRDRRLGLRGFDRHTASYAHQSIGTVTEADSPRPKESNVMRLQSINGRRNHDINGINHTETNDVDQRTNDAECPNKHRIRESINVISQQVKLFGRTEPSHYYYWAGTQRKEVRRSPWDTGPGHSRQTPLRTEGPSGIMHCVLKFSRGNIILPKTGACLSIGRQHVCSYIALCGPPGGPRPPGVGHTEHICANHAASAFTAAQTGREKTGAKRLLSVISRSSHICSVLPRWHGPIVLKAGLRDHHHLIGSIDSFAEETAVIGRGNEKGHENGPDTGYPPRGPHAARITRINASPGQTTATQCSAARRQTRCIPPAARFPAALPALPKQPPLKMSTGPSAT